MAINRAETMATLCPTDISPALCFRSKRSTTPAAEIAAATIRSSPSESSDTVVISSPERHAEKILNRMGKAASIARPVHETHFLAILLWSSLLRLRSRLPSFGASLGSTVTSSDADVECEVDVSAALNDSFALCGDWMPEVTAALRPG